MVIVTVWWKIRPGTVEPFKRWWHEKLSIADEHLPNLWGEYLSEPVSQAEVDAMEHRFNVVDPNETEETAIMVNVAIWKDIASFQQAVKPKDTSPDPSKEPGCYGAGLWKRIIFNPQETHRGTWPLPGPLSD